VTKYNLLDLEFFILKQASSPWPRTGASGLTGSDFKNISESLNIMNNLDIYW